MIALSFITSVYLIYQNIYPPYEPNPAYVIILFFGSVPVFIRLFLHRHILARIYGLGALLMILFFCLGFIWASGVQMPIHPFYWGFMTVVLFFSLGLAWKIRFNERAKAEAEQILELDKMKSRFFANISHEFRTPISLLLGPLKQAEEQIPASESLETADEVPIPGKYIKMMKREKPKRILRHCEQNW